MNFRKKNINNNNNKKAIKWMPPPIQYCGESTSISDWTNTFYIIIFLSYPTYYIWSSCREYFSIWFIPEMVHQLNFSPTGKAITFEMYLLHEIFFFFLGQKAPRDYSETSHTWDYTTSIPVGVPWGRNYIWQTSGCLGLV